MKHEAALRLSLSLEQPISVYEKVTEAAVVQFDAVAERLIEICLTFEYYW